jgi:hypothetical protein
LSRYVEIFGTIVVSCAPAVYLGWAGVAERVTAAIEKARGLVESGKRAAERARALVERVRVVERAKTVVGKARTFAGRVRSTWKFPKVLPDRRGRRDTEPVYSYPRQAPAVCGRCGQSCLYCAQNGRLTMTASTDQKLASLIIPLFSDEAAGAASQPGTSGPRLTGLGASGNVL